MLDFSNYLWPLNSLLIKIILFYTNNMGILLVLVISVSISVFLTTLAMLNNFINC